MVAGDLLDRASVAGALRGVRQVFLMTTRKGAGLEAEVRQGVTMADAAKAAGVEHLVYTSVRCVDRRPSATTAANPAPSSALGWSYIKSGT